jgi:hypothetical protein
MLEVLSSMLAGKSLGIALMLVQNDAASSAAIPMPLWLVLLSAVLLLLLVGVMVGILSESRKARTAQRLKNPH